MRAGPEAYAALVGGLACHRLLFVYGVEGLTIVETGGSINAPIRGHGQEARRTLSNGTGMPTARRVPILQHIWFQCKVVRVRCE